MLPITNYRTLAIYVTVFAGVCILCAFLYVQSATKNAAWSIKIAVAEQETKLATLTEIIERDGADIVVSELVKDCSPEFRARFDAQLARLETLRGKDLIEMEQLFEACGGYFAEQKAAMVARLSREYEVYTKLIELLYTLAPANKEYVEKNEKWKLLVSAQEQKALLSTKLVAIQGTIIRELKKGTTVKSDTLQSILVDGQKTKEELISLSSRSASLKEGVLSL